MFGKKKLTDRQLQLFEDEAAAVGAAEAVIAHWLSVLKGSDGTWKYEILDITRGINTAPAGSNDSGCYIYSFVGRGRTAHCVFRVRFKRFWVHRPKGESTGAQYAVFQNSEISLDGCVLRFWAQAERSPNKGMQSAWTITSFREVSGNISD